MAAITYEITDGDGLTDRATASILVTPVNDAPRPNADRVEGIEDQILTIPVLSLTGNDIDPDGQTFQLTAVSDVDGGSVALDGVGNVVFTPDADRNGDLAFNYVVTDIAGQTGTARVTVALQSVNDAPRLASPLADATFAEDAAVSVAVPPTSFTDAEDDPLTPAAPRCRRKRLLACRRCRRTLRACRDRTSSSRRAHRSISNGTRATL